jgi:cysteine synthase A
VLTEKTGATTIPQIFIAGRHIGGATDTFEAWQEGTLQKYLEDSGLAYEHDKNFNPFEFLPGWLHGRHSP